MTVKPGTLIRTIDKPAFLDRVRGDRELLHKLRDFVGAIRLDIAGDVFDIVIVDGVPTGIRDPEGDAEVVISAPEEFWTTALVQKPPRGFESLSVGGMHGAKTDGSFVDFIARYQGALQRLFIVLRESVAGPGQKSEQDPEPYRATDTAVGRYVFVKCDGVEARVYYEEAGTGDIPLVLQHTAGADSRQYRHMLANPELQQRFRMIAWDLPYHGKSLPPVGVRWWEQDYRPTKMALLQWNVAIADAIGLDRPIYLGCSVGGQLALDLAAFHADRFRAFVAVNGWYEIVSRGGYDNDVHRRPSTSTDYFASRILAATTPAAPEAAAQETYWVYRSNFPGVYAGDNDYFMNLHDLREDGHLIDTEKTPVYVVTGEYDASMLFPANGGLAVAQNIPGVIHRELAELGHFAPSDDPVRFCDAIIPILDEITAKCR